MHTTMRAGRREWIGLAVLALPCLLYSMDLTVLNLAVPQLSADLRPTSTQLLWIVDIYGFVLAGSLVTMGTLGDRIGRRRLLLIGAASFGVASVLSAFSTSAAMLIATRGLLGVAGATLAPSTLSLIRNMFLDARQRTVAIGAWAASFSAGAAIGPLVGGLLLEHFWWGSVFLAGVPVMALFLIVGPILLPEFRDAEAGRLDLLSAGLSLVAVLAVIFGVKQAAENGVGTTPVTAIALGVAVGVVFWRRQRTLADPLIDVRLFRVPTFAAALVTNVAGIFVAVGAFLFIAQYLQLVLGLSPLAAGLWTLPWSAGLVAGSMLAPAISRWFPPAHIVGTGLGLSASGLLVLTQLDASAGLVVLVAGSVVASLGLSVVVPLTTEMIVGSAPPEKAGAASAISETGLELGGALGIAILGTIGTAVYRAQMAGVGVGLPADAADAARDTLGGAQAVAGQLPASAGVDLLRTARQSFTQGMHVSALLAAAVAIAVGITAVVALRRTGRPPTEDSPCPQPPCVSRQFEYA